MTKGGQVRSEVVGEDASVCVVLCVRRVPGVVVWSSAGYATPICISRGPDADLCGRPLGMAHRLQNIVL